MGLADRRVHDRRLHRAGDVPHVLRRAARRRRRESTTRCTPWSTRHDPAHDVYQEPELQDLEHADAHAGPHESPKLLLVPICILAVFAFVGGWANAAMLEEKWHKFAEYVEPHVAHHEEEAAAGG